MNKAHLVAQQRFPPRIDQTSMSPSTIFPPPSLQPLLKSIASILTKRKQTIAITETAAGGLISASLLSIPGASAYYRGGLTLYTLPSRVVFGEWTEESVKSYT